MSKYDEAIAKIDALHNEIEELKNAVSAVTNEFIYNYVDSNMPDWARPVIQALRDVGVICGVDDEGNLGLKWEDLRAIVLDYRGGAYDAKLQVTRDGEGNITSSPIVEKYLGI